MTEMDFFCKKCSLQFGKKYVYDLHLSLVHGEKMEVKTEPPNSEKNSFKNEQLNYEEKFQKPQETVREKEASYLVVHKSIKCNICDATFKTNQNLKKHIRSVHEGKRFKCKSCDASFTQKDSLSRHVTSVHEGKKPFKCNICDANFTQKGNLNGHISLVHEGKKPFSCSICHTSFSRKAALNIHISSVHEGISGVMHEMLIS